MTEEKKTKTLLQWHPAFYAGLQIEFAEEIEKLIFENEHQLSKKPMEIDVLVIEKNAKEQIKKNIGRIFRKYNIVEYKSPEDYLSIDSFYKVIGYACFYKSDSNTADAIKIEEITISYVCEKRPEKLLKHLQEQMQASIIKYDKGVYYIKGFWMPIQLIITSELSGESNLWLRSLTNCLKERKEARNLLKEFGKHKNEGLYKSLMNVIVRANNQLFEEEKRMCDALLELMKDELDARENEGEKKVYLRLIREGILTIPDVAVRLGISEEQVREML